MKILRPLLTVLAAIIVLLLVIAAFVPKDYAVVREVDINRPKNEVFTYLKYLRNHDQFSVWAQMDPAMKKEYRGTDGTAGFVSAWDSQKDEVGKGEQEITSVTENERINYELRFIKPFESTCNAYMTTESTSEITTRVKWGFSGHMNYPMNVMMLFMNMEKMVGNDLETGLNNLKTVMEH
jgi:uncharacterized protein YndB with AHSA1/START domain